MKTRSTTWLAAALAMTLSSFATADTTLSDTAGERTTTVSQGLISGTAKNGKQKGLSQTRAADAPIAAGNANRSARKSASTLQSGVNQNFWIYDARTSILDDFDGDGFYTRLELTFDADTAFEGANVYAVLYLSLEGGDWVEYGETFVFDIFGSSGEDEYYFDTDLVSGFPRGYYDVLIELYDDFDQQLVAVYGPSDSADLFDLPLESQTTDSPVPPVVIITDEGGGGSAGLWMIASLALMLLGRVVVRRQRLGVTV